MNKKISGIVEYISYLLKKYSELQQTQMKHSFRVASIKKSAKGTKVIFQVIGKSTYMESTPAEILANDAFIEKFSKKDVQAITYAHAHMTNIKRKELLSPDLKLTQQEFNHEAGKIELTFEDKEGNLITKSADEIVTDKQTIDKLTRQDAINVSYIAGYEHSQNNLPSKSQEMDK
ncbi:MAG: hypothetical protein JO149_07305 [Gammaproteobacteria bacterium]|nr:hypothetical protein [Gammaproteobacteria bacterium]